MAAILSMHYLSYKVDAHTPGGIGNDPDSVLSANAQGVLVLPQYVC